MSYVPSGTWHSPAQPAPAPGSAHAGPDVWWRIRHSWWLLLPVVGFSCLAGFGFLYIGIRARRPAWWLSGIGYLLVSWTCFMLVGGTEQGSTTSDWAAGIYLLSWMTSITHAAVLNGSWLRWRAAHRPWYAAPPHVPGLTSPAAGQPTGHFHGAPPVSPGYPPIAPASPAYGPGSPSVPGPVHARHYQPTSGPPTGSYPHALTEPHLPPPVDPYASPPLDPDLPPPVDPYFGPLPGQEPPSPSSGYR